MSPENLKILIMILNALLVVVGGYLINAFFQPGLSRKRKRLLIALAITDGIMAAFLNSLRNPPPAGNYTYFIVGLVYLFSIIALRILWKTWSGSEPTNSEAKIRKFLLKSIMANGVLRLNTSHPLSSHLYPQNLPKLSNTDQRFPTVKRYFTIVPDLETLLEPQKTILEFFQSPEIQGKLLILGSPGSGKTTELLHLALSLCQIAIEDETQPLPIIVELSTWKPNLMIEEWLISELKSQYYINPDVIEKWINKNQIIFLFDGLDEREDLKEGCIEALKEFLSYRKYNLKRLVICSGIADYETCINQLDFKGAVRLADLTEQDIENDFKQQNLALLWQEVKADPDGFLTLARTPLFLYLIRESYSNGITTQKRQCNSDAEREHYRQECQATLLKAYVQQKLAEPHDNLGYSLEQAQRYLSWLAKTLRWHQTPEFFIEKMQPTWLETKAQWHWYRIVLGLIGGLIYGLIGVLTFGLIGGLIFGLMGGIIFKIIDYNSPTIERIEVIELSFTSLKRVLYNGLYCGLYSLYSSLIIGGIGMLIAIPMEWPIGAVIVGLAIPLIFNLMQVVIKSLRGDIKIRIQPNYGIWQSCNQAVIITIITFVLMMSAEVFIVFLIKKESNLIFYFKSILYLLNLAVLVGLLFGGVACLQHLTLRLILWFSNAVPWNYTRFLTYASERGLLKQSGGGYRFYHNVLQEHLAGEATAEP